jgi:hypothetical protein
VVPGAESRLSRMALILHDFWIIASGRYQQRYQHSKRQVGAVCGRYQSPANKHFIVSRDVSFTPESGHVRRSSLYSLWADSGPYNQLLSAFDGRHCHIRINDINRIPRRKCNDLVEDIAKLRLKFLSCDITNVWRRNDLF